MTNETNESGWKIINRIHELVYYSGVTFTREQIERLITFLKNKQVIELEESKDEGLNPKGPRFL